MNSENTSSFAGLSRNTNESTITVALSFVSRPQKIRISTGIGFLDHMLASMAFHAGWSLCLECGGDLHIDDHHSTEDCALALGEAFAILQEKQSAIARFGEASAPLDEALVRAVVDLGGRPFCRCNLNLVTAHIGALKGENIEHFFCSFATSAKINLHIDQLFGSNSHHIAEAAFKATALALKRALVSEISAEAKTVSTKGRVHTKILPQAELEAFLARPDHK